MEYELHERGHLAGGLQTNSGHDHVVGCSSTREYAPNTEQVGSHGNLAYHSGSRGEQVPLTVSMLEKLEEDGKVNATERYITKSPLIEIEGARTHMDIDMLANDFSTVKEARGEKPIGETSNSRTDLGRASPAMDQRVIEIKEEFCSDHVINPARWPEHVVNLIDDDVSRILDTIVVPENHGVFPETTKALAIEPISIQDSNDTSTAMNAASPQRCLLKRRKPMTPADQEKRVQLQQQMLRRHLATNVELPTFATNLPANAHSNVQSHLLQQESHDAPPREQSSKVYSSIGAKNHEGVMGNLDAPKEDDYDPYCELQAFHAEAKAAKLVFDEAKQRYKSRKRAGLNTREDDINFLALVTKEKIRQKQLKDMQTAAMEMSERLLNTYEISDDDTLFVAAKESTSGQNQFSSEQSEAKVRQEEIFGENQARRQPRRKRRQQNKVSEELIAVGMETERLNEMGKTKKGRCNRVSKPLKESSSRKTKASRVRTNKSQPRSLFRNFNSLFTSNIYTDGNRNHGITLPMSTQKNKQKALNEIVAAIPLEDRTIATRDKNDLLAASIRLGPRQCKHDPSGSWRLNGMKSLLRPYQVLAAAAMKDREDGISKPAGGILGDEMGFGKTVTTIATIIANPPPKGDTCKTTLIVVPASLLYQWQEEIVKHAEPGQIGRLVTYHSTQKLVGLSSEDIYRDCDVILTTYGEVSKSWPSYKPPQEIMTFAGKKEWYKQQLEHRGLLHRLGYFRVVLDEAQCIKNYLSQTSQAVRALDSKFRWAISGTPMMNAVSELYAYFKFLRVPYSGSIDVFKRNFCERGQDMQDICNARVQALLKQFLVRRTHRDLLMGQKLVDLPENHVMTVHVDFNSIEREIYGTVRKRFVDRINGYSKAGNLKLKYNNVLTMLLVLRQLCSHLYLVQDTIEEIFLLEDFEELWRLTADEVATADRPKSRDMLAEMSALFQKKDDLRGRHVEPQSPEEEATDQQLQMSRPLLFRFRQHLRDLAASDNFAELRNRSVCAKCRDSASEPHITSCNHLYCGECLRSMSYEASLRNEDCTECLACGMIYESATPCPALKELGFDEASSGAPDLGNQEASQNMTTAKRSQRWIESGRSVTPSSKAAAVLAQIQRWLEEEPACKIVVFTQFRLMITVLARLCADRQWGHCIFHGGMSHQSRNSVIKDFRENEEKHIMIASLKCGGVGLNLTMANRVICIDPWWNSPVEQQAFCRVYRIGQTQETYVTRVVVKQTVDDKLLKMQEDKASIINDAMGDGKRTGKLSVKDLMRLFGTLSDDNDDEDGPEFIIVEDEPETNTHLLEEVGQERPTYEDVVMLD